MYPRHFLCGSVVDEAGGEGEDSVQELLLVVGWGLGLLLPTAKQGAALPKESFQVVFSSFKDLLTCQSENPQK